MAKTPEEVIVSLVSRKRPVKCDHATAPCEWRGTSRTVAAHHAGERDAKGRKYRQAHRPQDAAQAKRVAKRDALIATATAQSLLAGDDDE